jgi:hypothetical protein
MSPGVPSKSTDNIRLYRLLLYKLLKQWRIYRLLIEFASGYRMYSRPFSYQELVCDRMPPVC